MANWSDPRPTAAGFARGAGVRGAAYDAGLRSYMLSVYNYMASGVLLTGIVALAFAYSGFAAQVFGGPGLLKYVFMLAPLGFVFAMSFGQGRMSLPTLQAMFWGFAVAMGLSLSTIFLQYTGTSIAGAFFATAAGFAGLSLWGYTTKKDLSAFGTFLIMGLVGLIVASLILRIPPLRPRSLTNLHNRVRQPERRAILKLLPVPALHIERGVFDRGDVFITRRQVRGDEIEKADSRVIHKNKSCPRMTAITTVPGQ